MCRHRQSGTRSSPCRATWAPRPESTQAIWSASARRACPQRRTLFSLALRARARVMFFFFFQAEDGIRDLTVTGVQTCALPIFFNQVRLSGVVPQVCVLFGPSAAGGAYIPAFCDLVIMRDGNASMYLGSPRMAEMVIGEKVTLEEMGGARMHTGVSGCGHQLVASDEEGITLARRYLSYLPASWGSAAPPAPPAPPAQKAAASIAQVVPADENQPFDMGELIEAIIDEGSLLEIHPRWARELIVGYARLDGQAIGVVANQPKHKGGVLFSDSADKAARFIWTCNAFNVPLLFLADVPGFMIGTAVEREGIIRHGAKMISAVSEATVPKISVIVRKAYGAGLYAMAGPA